MLPEIFKVVDSDFNLYKDFIKDCIEYSFFGNFFYQDTPITYEEESIHNWLGTDQIYICTNNNKNIGFVSITYSTELSEVPKVSMFVHPRVCKMSSLNVARAAVAIMDISGRLNGDSLFFISTVHPLVFTIISSTFSVNVLKHSNYYLISCKSDSDKFNTYSSKNFNSEDLKHYMEVLK